MMFPYIQEKKKEKPSQPTNQKKSNPHHFHSTVLLLVFFAVFLTLQQFMMPTPFAQRSSLQLGASQERP